MISHPELLLPLVWKTVVQSQDALLSFLLVNVGLKYGTS